MISIHVHSVSFQVDLCCTNPYKTSDHEKYSIDAIKHIELKGPADHEVSQDSSLAFHVDGR